MCVLADCPSRCTPSGGGLVPPGLRRQLASLLLFCGLLTAPVGMRWAPQHLGPSVPLTLHRGRDERGLSTPPVPRVAGSSLSWTFGRKNSSRSVCVCAHPQCRRGVLGSQAGDAEAGAGPPYRALLGPRLVCLPPSPLGAPRMFAVCSSLGFSEVLCEVGLTPALCFPLCHPRLVFRVRPSWPDPPAPVGTRAPVVP